MVFIEAGPWETWYLERWSYILRQVPFIFAIVLPSHAIHQESSHSAPAAPPQKTNN